MGRIKRFKIKIVKERKWHILKEKFLRLEEIKEELIIKLALKQLKFVKKLENLIYIIMRMNMRESSTIEGN
tara:strand:- start:163 stop:375 length:213 start_codon:yes stop_codon:yes gene_type:complete